MNTIRKLVALTVLLTSVLAHSALAQVSAAADEPVDLVNSLLSGRAVPGSFGGVVGSPVVFNFPRGRHLIKNVLCRPAPALAPSPSPSSSTSLISPATVLPTPPTGRIYLENPSGGYYVDVPFQRSEGVQVLSYQASNPLFLNATSGSARVRIDDVQGLRLICSVTFVSFPWWSINWQLPSELTTP